MGRFNICPNKMNFSIIIGKVDVKPTFGIIIEKIENC